MTPLEALAWLAVGVVVLLVAVAAGFIVVAAWAAIRGALRDKPAEEPRLSVDFSFNGEISDDAADAIHAALNRRERRRGISR